MMTHALVMRLVGILACFLGFIGSGRVAGATDASAYRSVALSLRILGPQRIVLAHPAQIIDPAYEANDPAQGRFVSAMLNQMLAQSLTAKAAPFMLDATYSQILSQSVWATVPLGLNDRAARDSARSLLFTAAQTPTAGYQKYLELQAALATIDSRIQNSPHGDSDPVLQQQRAQAVQDLKLSGHSAKYAPAEARYRDLTSKASYTWLDADRSRVSSATRQADGYSFLETQFSKNLDDLGADSWISINIDQLQAPHDSASVPLGQTVLDPIDWWAFTDSAPVTSKCNSRLTAGSTHVKWESAVVGVQRSWFDRAVFDSRAWRYANMNSNLSDGADQGNTGTAPEYIIGVIVARNIEISGDGISQCVVEIRTALRNRKSTSFGPFAVAGYAASPSMSYLMPQLTRDKLRVPFIQVIAYVTSTLPASPNPNLDFVW